MAESERATDGWVISFEDTASTLDACIVNGTVSVTDTGDLMVYDSKGANMLAIFADGIWRSARRIRIRQVPDGRWEPADV